MTLSVATARQRIAASLEALNGWAESRWTGTLWPAQETREAHLRFAVLAGDTVYQTPIESARGRRPDAVGSFVLTTFRVLWMYRIKADAAVADYDLMLAAEDTAVEAILATARTDGLRLAIVRRSRTTQGDGTFSLGEIEVAAQHQVPI
jgi:hypothetical protein